MTTELMIGTSYVGLAYLDTFYSDSRDREPRALSIDYAARIEAGDGSRPGSGWAEQKWVFGRLTEHYWDHLMAFKDTAVYIRTRKNDGTYGYYTAVMVIPTEEPEHFAGRVLNAELLFRAMVVYTP